MNQKRILQYLVPVVSGAITYYLLAFYTSLGNTVSFIAAVAVAFLVYNKLGR